MNLLSKIGIGLVVVATAVASGYYLAPTKVEEKEKIVYQDKIVEKIVYVKKTNKKTNKTTIRLVTIKPDGTKTVETKIVDNSELIVDQSKQSDKTEVSSKTDEKSKVVERDKESTIISAAYKLPGVYGAAIDKRLLGPVWVGGFGFIDGTFGLKLGLGF